MLRAVAPLVFVVTALVGAGCGLLGGAPCARDGDCGDDARCAADGFCITGNRDDGGARRDDGGARDDAGAPMDGGAPAEDDGGLGDDGGPSLDGGALPLDGGTLPLDGGVPPLDSGAASTDAGTPLVDAGAPDAGAPLVDAGSPDAGANVVDAGSPDAGAPVDAGNAVPDAGPALPPCGDGLIGEFEDCDDANDIDAGGCTDCVVDFNAYCYDAPSLCTLGTVRAPSTFETLQSAINTAAPGDLLVLPAIVYAECVSITKDLMLLGQPGTVVTCNSQSAATIRVAGTDDTRVDVVLQGFEVKRTANAAAAMGRGVHVDAFADVRLQRMKIGYAPYQSVVAATGSSIVVRGCTFSSAEGYALALYDANAVVENTLFTGNAGPTTLFLFRDNITVRFVTIVDDDSSIAMECAGPSPTTVIGALIETNGAPFSGNCVPSRSAFAGAAEPANVVGNPAVGVDGHIGPGSSCIDAVPGPGPRIDIDGEVRPAGVAFDCGADERP